MNRISFLFYKINFYQKKIENSKKNLKMVSEIIGRCTTHFWETLWKWK